MIESFSNGNLPDHKALKPKCDPPTTKVSGLGRVVYPRSTFISTQDSSFHTLSLPQAFTFRALGAELAGAMNLGRPKARSLCSQFRRGVRRFSSSDLSTPSRLASSAIPFQVHQVCGSLLFEGPLCFCHYLKPTTSRHTSETDC